MRNINKGNENVLATQYIEYQKGKTSKYYSGSPHYDSVLVNLLICQNGCCAYTEIRLVPIKTITIMRDSFKNGKYEGVDFYHKDIHIEHFYMDIKKTYPWKWGNLFAVEATVNKIKGELEPKNKRIKEILKPDNSNYDSKKYLEYNSDIHRFFPKGSLYGTEISKDIKVMINVLGLNNDRIIERRKEYFEFLDGHTEKQFYTASEMMNSQR